MSSFCSQPSLHISIWREYPDTVVVTTTVLNKKISELENKTPDSSSLVTATVLNTKVNEIENKIPNHAKYTTTQEFNKLSAEHFES